MSIKIPKNIIIESKYTQGKEYMTVETYKEYQGYYYELNGKIFAGKEFDVFAPELMKFTSNKINPLLTKLSTYVYGVIAGSNNLLPSTIINTVVTNSNLIKSYVNTETYYAKKINEIPYSIKQIDKATYDNLQSNPFYKTVVLNPNKPDLEQAEKQIPGLKAFLGIE
jgi:hypothetical protein